MHINASGLLNTAQFIASPNYDERPTGTNIDLLVIHNISLPPNEFSGNAVIELFTNRLNSQAHPYYQFLQGLRLSTHFFIRRNGTVIQFVSCNDRAWHAGVSCWQGRERCNDYSIGIELEGSDITPFTDAQYVTLISMTKCLCNHYPIKLITGHSDISPGRKTDPGPYFNWENYAMCLGDNKFFITKDIP